MIQHPEKNQVKNKKLKVNKAVKAVADSWPCSFSILPWAFQVIPDVIIMLFKQIHLNTKYIYIGEMTIIKT